MVWVILISLMRMDWCGYSLVSNPFTGYTQLVLLFPAFAVLVHDTACLPHCPTVLFIFNPAKYLVPANRSIIIAYQAAFYNQLISIQFLGTILEPKYHASFINKQATTWHIFGTQILKLDETVATHNIPKNTK